MPRVRLIRLPAPLEGARSFCLEGEPYRTDVVRANGRTHEVLRGRCHTHCFTVGRWLLSIQF